MATKYIHEIARERGITSKEALEVLRNAGLDVEVAASKVEEEDANGAFGNEAARRLPPQTPLPLRPRSQTPRPRKQRPPIELDGFIARVDAERPEQLPVEEVARVSPQPWFTRSGSGERARIRLPLGDQKYERRQGEKHWRRVDRWTMGPPR